MAYLSPVSEGKHIDKILPPVKNNFFTNVPLYRYLLMSPDAY